jgi:hypothetical protein
MQVKSGLIVVWLLSPLAGCVLPPGLMPASAEPPSPAAAVASGEDDVIVNGVKLTRDQIAAFERRHRLRIPPGTYWYDSESGAWGVHGGPTSGFTRNGLIVGAALRADASGGGDGQLTGVFINGREIHRDELALLSQYVELAPGRYWVDSDGNAGVEGLPAMVNLREQAQASGNEEALAVAEGYPGDGDVRYLFAPPKAADAAATELLVDGSPWSVAVAGEYSQPDDYQHRVVTPDFTLELTEWPVSEVFVQTLAEHIASIRERSPEAVVHHQADRGSGDFEAVTEAGGKIGGAVVRPGHGTGAMCSFVLAAGSDWSAPLAACQSLRPIDRSDRGYVLPP